MAKKEDFNDDLLLKNVDSEQVQGFFEDFSSLINMIKSLNAAWSEADNELYEALEIFENYVTKFNEKYPGLKVKFTNTMDQGFRLFVFFPKENSLADIFRNAAGRLQGLVGIGAEANDTLKPTPENIKAVLVRVRDKLFLAYARGGSASVILEMDKKEKMPELIFSIDTISNPDSAEFAICAFYATREINKKIDLKPIRLKFPSIVSAPNVDNVGALKG